MVVNFSSSLLSWARAGATGLAVVRRTPLPRSAALQLRLWPSDTSKMVAVPKARVNSRWRRPHGCRPAPGLRPGSGTVQLARRDLLTAGELDPVIPAASGGLATQVATALDGRAGNGRAVAIGAVPFDTVDPAHLFVPRSVRWAPGRAHQLSGQPGASVRSLTPVPVPRTPTWPRCAASWRRPRPASCPRRCSPAVCGPSPTDPSTSQHLYGRSPATSPPVASSRSRCPARLTSRRDT